MLIILAVRSKKCNYPLFWTSYVMDEYLFRYQLIVMLSDNNDTESQESNLDETLIDQVNYIYIAAEFNDTEPMNTIELGDGKYYGKYLNKPLVPGLCYQVAIRIVYNKVSSLTVVLEHYAIITLEQ